MHINLLSVEIIDKQLPNHSKQNEGEKVAMPNRVHVNLKLRRKENIITKCVLRNSSEFQKVHIREKYNDVIFSVLEMLLRNAYQKY